MTTQLVLGCDWKLSVGLTQTGHMDLLPPQVYGSSWRGHRLSFTTCWRQYNILLDIKYYLSYLDNTFFVDCWLVYITFNVSAFIDPETFPWARLKKRSVERIHTRHKGLINPQVCGRSCLGCRLCGCIIVITNLFTELK